MELTTVRRLTRRIWTSAGTASPLGVNPEQAESSGQTSEIGVKTLETCEEATCWNGDLDQLKQLQQSQSNGDRVSECNEPQVVRDSEGQQGHSRNHFEEVCQTEPDKCKDDRTHRHDADDAPPDTTTQHTPAQHEWALCDRCHTAWASGAHVCVPAGHPRYTRADFDQEAVGGSTARARARGTGHRHTSCEHGKRPNSLVAE